MTTMKAVQIHAYGEPEVLSYEETARPAPKPDEVLIHVHAAAINPFDSAIRAGLMQEMISCYAAKFNKLYYLYF